MFVLYEMKSSKNTELGLWLDDLGFDMMAGIGRKSMIISYKSVC